MNISITKEYTFEAAHQLPLHSGKCKNLHGHSYQLMVTLSGPIQKGGSSDGMIMDFAELNPIIKSVIIDKYDHQFLNDLLPFTTTVENLCVHFFIELKDAGLPISSLTLYETKKCFATVTE